MNNKDVIICAIAGTGVFILNMVIASMLFLINPLVAGALVVIVSIFIITLVALKIMLPVMNDDDRDIDGEEF